MPVSEDADRGAADRGAGTGGGAGIGGGADAAASGGWRALAPAKVNLGLFVGPVRADGRHELASVMQSISLADELRMEACGVAKPSVREGHGVPKRGVRETCDVAKRGVRETCGVPKRGVRETPDGPQRGVRDELVCPGVEGPASENLALRALSAFRDETGWDAPAMRLTVEKRVPIAAGLGGGSGDAAAALRLAAVASGGRDEELLLRIAAALGADVPAQVRPGRRLARGAGEVISKLPDPRPPLGVLVLPSTQALSTAAVYAQLDRQGRVRASEEVSELAQALSFALASGEALPSAELLHNDLESPAIALCPSIEGALDAVKEAGADVGVLSGSGPTVLGLFGGDDGPRRAEAAAKLLAHRRPAPLATVSVSASFGEAEALPLGNRRQQRVGDGEDDWRAGG